MGGTGDGAAQFLHRDRKEMQVDTKSRTKKPLNTNPDGFDVTSVIGRVTFTDHGDDSPHVAAFKVIAQHDNPGEFTFPSADGGTVRVSVDYEGPVNHGPE